MTPQELVAGLNRDLDKKMAMGKRAGIPDRVAMTEEAVRLTFAALEGIPGFIESEGYEDARKAVSALGKEA